MMKWQNDNIIDSQVKQKTLKACLLNMVVPEQKPVLFSYSLQL